MRMNKNTMHNDTGFIRLFKIMQLHFRCFSVTSMFTDFRLFKDEKTNLNLIWGENHSNKIDRIS